MVIPGQMKSSFSSTDQQKVKSAVAKVLGKALGQGLPLKDVEVLRLKDTSTDTQAFALQIFFRVYATRKFCHHRGLQLCTKKHNAILKVLQRASFKQHLAQTLVHSQLILSEDAGDVSVGAARVSYVNPAAALAPPTPHHTPVPSPTSVHNGTDSPGPAAAAAAAANPANKKHVAAARQQPAGKHSTLEKLLHGKGSMLTTFGAGFVGIQLLVLMLVILSSRVTTNRVENEHPEVCQLATDAFC